MIIIIGGLKFILPGTYTGCGRNSELIINKDNILLKVIDTNSSTSWFTTGLKIFFTYFLFLCTVSFRWPPPSSMHSYTLVKKLCITPWSVSSESCQVCELRTADHVVFYEWQSLFYATALNIDGLHLEMELPVHSFHGEILTESL